VSLLISYLLVAALFGVPVAKICQRAGLNPALGMLTLIPVFGVFIAIGVVAFREWPNEPAGYR
jgi:hypothetical protein